MRMGKSGYQAALDAADEIGLAVVATSFTIIAVFLPVSFMGGITGQYFKQFGLTVAVAVFISLMVARLITPVLAAYSLRGDEVGIQHADGPIMTLYLSLLRWCVANRWKTIAAGTAFFALSVLALSIIPQAFLPPEDFSNSQLNIELPPGGTLEDTARDLRGCRRAAQEIARSDRLIEFVGWRRRGSKRRHLRQSGAAQRAQDEPEGMGAKHDAHPQSGSRRTSEFFQPSAAGAAATSSST